MKFIYSELFASQTRHNIKVLANGDIVIDLPDRLKKDKFYTAKIVEKMVNKFKLDQVKAQKILMDLGPNKPEVEELIQNIIFRDTGSWLPSQMCKNKKYYTRQSLLMDAFNSKFNQKHKHRFDSRVIIQTQMTDKNPSTIYIEGESAFSMLIKDVETWDKIRKADSNPMDKYFNNMHEAFKVEIIRDRYETKYITDSYSKMEMPLPGTIKTIVYRDSNRPNKTTFIPSLYNLWFESKGKFERRFITSNAPAGN